jgi:CRISPR/Cas system-associated endonuclease Cas1
MRRSKAKIRIKAISKGYDPTIGVMHDGSDGSLKFIFDLMELERPKSIVPCWISSRRTSSIQRILSFGRTAYVDLTRKWRGCWWRGFRHRTATAGIDVKRTSRIAVVDASVGREAHLVL